MPSVALDSVVGDVARSSDSALDHSAGLGDTAWKKQLGETIRPSSPAEKIPTEKTLGYGTEPGIVHEPTDPQAAQDALRSPPPPQHVPSRAEKAIQVKAPEPILREPATREPVMREPVAPIKKTAEEEPETQIGHEPTATRHAPDDEPHVGTTDRPSDEVRAQAAEREVEEFRSVGESFDTATTDETVLGIVTIPDDTSRPSLPSADSDARQRAIDAVAKEAREAMDRRHLEEDRRVS